MKFMISTYGTQRDYDAMGGAAGEEAEWSPDDFEAMGAFMDGPFAETQEVLAGYWIVDCASFDRATEIAARLSAVPGPASVQARAYADVRPIIESRVELLEG